MCLAKFVLYWMHSAMRADENPTLDVAICLPVKTVCHFWFATHVRKITPILLTASTLSFCRASGTLNGPQQHSGSLVRRPDSDAEK